MDISTAIGLLIALVALAAVAFPEVFFPERKSSKKVGSSYWGFYNGSEEDEPEELKTITVETPARKQRMISGSAMYAKGRGTSFRM